jgi:hypothetical protein
MAWPVSGTSYVNVRCVGHCRSTAAGETEAGGRAREVQVKYVGPGGPVWVDCIVRTAGVRVPNPWFPAACVSRFGRVEVRLYPRLLGGSQGVPKDGYAPLGLDWNEQWSADNVQTYACTDTHKKTCPKPRGELTETQRQACEIGNTASANEFGPLTI